MEVEANEWMAHSDFLAHFGVLGMKWGRRKKPSILERYKKHKKTEKQYNEDVALYSKKGAKRIAEDMDNKITLKGARSKEASRFREAQRNFAKAQERGAKVGQVAGTIAGYGAAYAGKRLAYKIMNNRGQLNKLGRFVATANPRTLGLITATAGATIGSKAGKSIAGRVSAARSKQEYKHLKKRRY